jgi:hypothetical protein
MRTKVIVLYLAFSCVACTTTEILDFPEATQLPVHWGEINVSRFSGSNCPSISGKYSEPPDIYQVDKNGHREFQGIEGSYYGFIPFHIAKEVKHESNKLGLSANQFLLQQVDSSNFTMAYLTPRSNLVEYLFNADNDDFKCNEGYIEFPVFISYGMLEGQSVNAQVRSILFKDENGALIVRRTIGPYRKYLVNTKNTFTDEFLRFQLTGN